MKMRPLVIDDAARAAIAKIEAYAKTNHYRKGQMPPGLDSKHVVVLNTYRVVFSYTEANDQLFRHLSISVPGNLYPNPASAFLLASEFGFTGWDQTNIDQMPKGWGIKVNEKEHCIVIAQEIKE
jgi:hypothetical protein